MGFTHEISGVFEAARDSLVDHVARVRETMARSAVVFARGSLTWYIESRRHSEHNYIEHPKSTQAFHPPVSRLGEQIIQAAELGSPEVSADSPIDTRPAKAAAALNLFEKDPTIPGWLDNDEAPSILPDSSTLDEQVYAAAVPTGEVSIDGLGQFSTLAELNKSGPTTSTETPSSPSREPFGPDYFDDLGLAA